MKKLLLSSAFVLSLVAAAYGQNIVTSLQGSQDPRGVVGVDASNNVYIPNHLNFLGIKGAVAPTYSGATGLTTNTDNQGVVTTTGTTLVITFGQAFSTAPACVLQEIAGTVAPTFTSYITGINASTVASSKVYNYLCFSYD